MIRRLLLLIGTIAVLAIISIQLDRILEHFRNTIEISGTLEAKNIDVVAETGGTVKEIFFPTAARVKKGDTLLSLDDEKALILLKQSEENLTIAELQLKKAKKGARPEEKRQANANLIKAESELNNTRSLYEKSKTLYKTGSISTQEMEDIEMHLKLSESNYEIAKEAQKIANTGIPLEDKKIIEQHLALANENVHLAKLEYNKTKIKSPINGLIEEIYYEKGEFVQAGSVVARIIDLNSLYLQGYIPQHKLRHTKVGKQANIILDAYPDKKFQGKIKEISQKAEFTPRNVQTKEDRVLQVYRIKISILNSDNILLPGTTGEAHILKE